jgi:hypothetical protein
MPAVGRNTLLEEPYDKELLQFASQKTRKRLEQSKGTPAYEAIIANVRAKYGPGLEEWKVIQELTSNFQNLAVEQDVPMEGSRRRKYRGGGPPPPGQPVNIPPPKMPGTPTTTLSQVVINDAMRLWLSFTAALGTPETVGTSVALAAVGVANPAAAGAAFSLANKLVGLAYGLATPTTFTLTVLTALLYRNFGNLLEKKETPTNLQELLTKLKENLNVAKVKYGAVAMPSAEIMAALDKLEKAAAAEKAAAEAKAASDAKAAADSAAAAAVAEKEAKVAVEQTITAAQTSVDKTIETPSTAGRRTKKGGKKKMRKTRRPARVFKY